MYAELRATGPFDAFCRGMSNASDVPQSSDEYDKPPEHPDCGWERHLVPGSAN